MWWKLRETQWKVRTLTAHFISYSVSKMNWKGHYWMLTIFWDTQPSNLSMALCAAQLIYYNDFPQLAKGLQLRMNWEFNLPLVPVALLKNLWFYQITWSTCSVFCLSKPSKDLIIWCSSTLGFEMDSYFQNKPHGNKGKV